MLSISHLSLSFMFHYSNKLLFLFKTIIHGETLKIFVLRISGQSAIMSMEEILKQKVQNHYKSNHQSCLNAVYLSDWQQTKMLWIFR